MRSKAGIVAVPNCIPAGRQPSPDTICGGCNVAEVFKEWYRHHAATIVHRQHRQCGVAAVGVAGNDRYGIFTRHSIADAALGAHGGHNSQGGAPAVCNSLGNVAQGGRSRNGVTKG